MEAEEKWENLVGRLQKQFGKAAAPDLNAVLFLIGIREFGVIKNRYTKEEKEDLMHIAVCRILSRQGYYALKGLDKDGWPHWEQLKPVPKLGTQEQERLLKQEIILYFEAENIFQ